MNDLDYVGYERCGQNQIHRAYHCFGEIPVYTNLHCYIQPLFTTAR
jgi:hypothetical protein